MRLQPSDYKYFTEIRVYWGDMDAAQHVNNLVYLRWAETARIDYFAASGAKMNFKMEGVGPILGWQECKYIFPLTFPDTVKVGVRTLEVLEDRMIIECAFFSKKYDRLAAISKQSVVPYDYDNLKRAPMPQNWIDVIEKLEGKSFKIG